MSGADWKEKWQQRLTKAQSLKQFVINGQEYDRIAYGFEEDAMSLPKCDDCGAPRGMLHIPGCDIESCPRCSGQAIRCDCFYDERPGKT